MSEVENLKCSNCGKECKNKKGLSKHQFHCDISRVEENRCSFCNKEFSSSANLQRHLIICRDAKAYDSQKKTEEENQAYIEVFNKRLYELERQLEQKESIHKEQYTVYYSQYYNDYYNQHYNQHYNEYYNDYYKKHYSVSVSLLEQDIKILRDKQDEYKIYIDRQEAIIEEQRKKINAHELDSKYEQKRLIDVISTICKQTHSNTILQTNNNIQQTTNFIIQPFEQSAFKGYIKPPDVWVSNAKQLVDLFFRHGLSNYFRISDMSRKSAIWIMPGRGEVKDPQCGEFVHHLISNIREDIHFFESYHQNKLKSLEQAEPRDRYLIEQTKQLLAFCKDLKDNDETLIEEIKHLISSNGKHKNNTTVDAIRSITYTRFVSSIQRILSKDIRQWISKSFEELGKYLGDSSLEYHLEGASMSSMYIVIEDDDYNRKIVYADQLQDFLKAVGESLFGCSGCRSLVCNLLMTTPQDEITKVEEKTNYFENPDIDNTKQLIKGLISSRR